MHTSIHRVQQELSSPKPGHTTGGSGRGSAQLGGGAGRVGTPAGVFAQETTDPHAFQCFDDECFERLLRSTTKRNLM